MLLYERLKLFRKEKLQLNQTEFGKKIGVSRSVIKNLELGVVEVKEHMVKLICQTFNVREEWLRDGIEPIFNEETKEEYNILKELENQGVHPNVLELIEVYLECDDKSKIIVDQYLEELYSKRKSKMEKQEQQAKDKISITSDDTNKIV